MTSDDLDLEPEERRLLREGYDALGPPSAKKDFILGALSVRLPGALVPLASDEVTPLTKGGLGRALGAKVAGGLVIGALGFALGMRVSSPASSGDSTHALQPVPREPPVSIPIGSGDAPGALALGELDAEPTTRLDTKVQPAKPGTASTSTESPAEVSFYEELSYIRRAQTALASGNPALALGLMRSLRELHGGGALLAERGMTEVLALCALDRPAEARTVADSVRARSDGSMYVARLDKTCARSGVAADSSDASGGQATSTGQTSKRKE